MSLDVSNDSFWENSYDDWLRKDDWEVALRASVLGVIATFGLIGNLSIIIVILRNRLLLLQPTNLFLLNMCISDSLNLLINPVLYFHQQGVIYRFYVLAPFFCEITPFLAVALMLASVLSLTTISVMRYMGIAHMEKTKSQFNRKVVIGLLIGIWLLAGLAASPTLIFRHYWTRQWKDLLEINCDDRSSGDWKFYGELYWTCLLTILVWIPTIAMVICYSLIFRKIHHSIRRIPYQSSQSRSMRARRGVEKILSILLIVQIISWAPWQIFTLMNQFYEGEPGGLYVTTIAPILFDIKYYFIFTGCAINPFLYGYCNETMRKAFKLTFPCCFKEKPDYILKRNGGGLSTFTFTKIIPFVSGPKMPKQLQNAAVVAVAPINANMDSHLLSPNNEGRTNVLERLARMISKPLGQDSNSDAVVKGKPFKKSNSEGDILDGDTVRRSLPVGQSLNQQRKRKASFQTASSHILGLPAMIKRKLSSSLEPTSSNVNPDGESPPMEVIDEIADASPPLEMKKISTMSLSPDRKEDKKRKVSAYF